MSNIEPTEEQRRAAAAHCLPVDSAGNPPSYTAHWVKTGENVRTERGFTVSAGPVALARLLAEREAKLRGELHTEKLVAEKALAARNEMENERDAARRDLKQSKAMSEAARDTLRARVVEAESALNIYAANDEKAGELLKRAGLDDTVNVVPRLAALVDETVALRARVAELEVHANTAMDNRDAHKAYAIELEEREAQHLADIKALKAKRLTDMREAARWAAELAFNVDDHIDDTKIAADIMEEFATFDAEDELLQRLAHYDDAKAAEGGEG